MTQSVRPTQPTRIDHRARPTQHIPPGCPTAKGEPNRNPIQLQNVDMVPLCLSNAPIVFGAFRYPTLGLLLCFKFRYYGIISREISPDGPGNPSGLGSPVGLVYTSWGGYPSLLGYTVGAWIILDNWIMPHPPRHSNPIQKADPIR